MKHRRKTALGIRVGKRKKPGRYRGVITLLVLVLAGAAIYFMDVGGAIDKVWHNTFTASQDNENTIIPGTADDTNNSGTQESTLVNPDTSDGETTDSGITEQSTTGDMSEGTNQDMNTLEPAQQPRDVTAIKDELENYIKGFKGQYGIYYINLADGTEFGINDTDEYTAASTVKVPINLQLFKRIQDGSINPEGVMTYTNADYEGGTGSIQYKKIGTKYTVRELSKLSIEQSDNVAVNMLIRLLGGRASYKKFMRDAGGTVVDDKKNISSPRDMALYMKQVYDFYREDQELGGELIGYLENTIFNDRIPKLLPPDVKVAHKIGNQVGCLHDVGIVFAKKPYIIAIMSRNVLESEAYDVIANISKKVYDYETEEK